MFQLEVIKSITNKSLTNLYEMNSTVLNISKFKDKPQPNRNRFLLLNVVHSFEPGETPSYSASHQDPNYVRRSKIK